jgi:tRNA-dihydrouridine synthase A
MKNDTFIKELHIAPMLNVSTVEFRTFMRILTKRCTIWTEMIVDETIYFNRINKDDVTNTTDTKPSISSMTAHESLVGTSDDDNLLWTVPQHLLPPVPVQDHPIVCQIGGICSTWTATATQLIIQAGYNQGEINLNLDCPSSRVQGKEFGAILMNDIPRTIELIQAMRSNVSSNVRVSVKCRIGIVDNATDLDWIINFINQLSSVCTRFIIHARSVVLCGLSPAQNRSVPPLNYPLVYQLCNIFPHCDFVINGGISNLRTAKDICYGTDSFSSHPQHSVPCILCHHPSLNGSCIAPPSPVPMNLRGCMLGRAAIDNPAQFALADRYWFGVANDCENPDDTTSTTTRRHVIERYCIYLDQIYPRRCCDNDHVTVTHELPAPNITQNRPFCCICKEFRQSTFNDTTMLLDELRGPLHVESLEPSLMKIKIATRIIDRAVRPTLGLFYQQDGSKTFRRTCEVLSRDRSIRNCGPAYILYQAVQSSISSHILDKPLVEELP